MSGTDSVNLAGMRDDIGTLLMAIKTMRGEVSKSGIRAHAKRNLENHYQNVIDELTFVLIILKGLDEEGKPNGT